MNGAGAALAAHPAVEGCYEAARAAALSGVPISTVYYWANREVVTPSVSPVRTRLWSYGDLMALRIVSWLRHPKAVDDGLLPASPMPEVRRVLSLLDKLGLDLWRPNGDRADRSPLLVDRAGHAFVWAEEDLLDSTGRPTLNYPLDGLELLAPYVGTGQRGPDLLRPVPICGSCPARSRGSHTSLARV